MNAEKTRGILETALRNGGNILMDHFGKSSDAVVKESISSVVTEADLASEKVIIDSLMKTPEPFNIISEESGYIHNGSEYTWVVDPLDGTSNFAAGLPWFGIILTLFHARTPIQAALYLPKEDQLYYAETGKGAFLNGTSIECNLSSDLTEILVAYSFDFSSDPGKTDSEMNIMGKLSKKIRNTRSTNSLIDFCYTADGRLGAAINQSTKIWDIAAPWLVIQEAGGVVTDISGAEIDFNLSQEAVTQNYTIVAAGSAIHGQLMSVIHKH